MKEKAFFKSIIALTGILLFVFLNSCAKDDLQSAIGSIQVLDCNADNCMEADGCAVIPGDQPTFDFGNVPKETMSQRRLTIKSSNTRNLTISSISIPSEFANQFNLYAIIFVDIDGTEEKIDFAEALPISIKGEQLIHVILRYLPLSSDLIETTLSIESNDQSSATTTVPVRGGGGILQICVGDDDSCSDVRSIDFGTQEIGSDTIEIVTINNIGSSDVTMTAIWLKPGLSPDFFKEGPDCKRIAPGQSGIIEVLYNPSDGGTDYGVLQIGSTDFNQSIVDIELFGRAVGPKLCAEPFPVDFGEVVELTTKTIPLRLYNCGYEYDLDISNIILQASANLSPDFALDADTDTAQNESWEDVYGTSLITLAPDQSTFIHVKYTPDGVGGDAGDIRVESNDPRMPLALIPIGGTGREPPRCELISVPEEVDFGWVAEDLESMGCTETSIGVCATLPPQTIPSRVSRRVDFFLKNKGEIDCTDVVLGEVFSYNLPEGVQPGDWEYVIEADPNIGTVDAESESGPITVLFYSKRPSGDSDPNFVPPEFTAKLKVYSPNHGSVFLPEDATGRYLPVQLRAEAGGNPKCRLAIDAMSGGMMCGGIPGVSDAKTLNFGGVNIASSKMIPLRMRNIGALDCRVHSIARFPGTSSDFSFATEDFDIPVNSTGSIDITLTPSAIDPSNPFAELRDYLCMMNQVTFKSESLDAAGTLMGDDDDHTVSFSGRATIPNIDVIPGRVDFGEVTLGCCSQEQTITVYNAGDGTLEISSIALELSSDPTFHLMSGANNTGDLVPGARFQMVVKFCPAREGDLFGMLTIESTADNNAELTIPLAGFGTLDSHGDDSFVQPLRPQVDVLFVIDDSGSMSEEQDAIASNFSSFITQASTLDTDYNLGVILPEVESEDSGKLWACNSNKFITSDQAVSAQQSEFECNVRTSQADREHSDSKEAPLQAARKALDYPNHDPSTHYDYNDGFLREAAKLFLILVTDEVDQSDGPYDLYVDFFRSLKGFGNHDMLNISAITGDYPGGCETASENQVDYDAAMATGGQFQSICSPDWSGMLTSLGLDVFNTRTQFTLSRPAEADTIEVVTCSDCLCDEETEYSCVDCCPTCTGVIESSSDGWQFSSEFNAVSFNGESVPGPGDCVEIEYEAICY